jgi:Cu+-exporting ATPase
MEQVAKYFVPAVILIAISAGLVWYFEGVIGVTFLAFVSAIIITIVLVLLVLLLLVR